MNRVEEDFNELNIAESGEDLIIFITLNAS